MTLPNRIFGALFGAAAVFTAFSAVGASEQNVIFVDQGQDWTQQLRAALYVQDQGSQLIPFAWLKALQQADGTAFLDGALTRYGYLLDASSMNGLPVGFTLADAQQGPTVGMTCAACHTRQIDIDGTAYRIDGGPAFADFQRFVVDLDDSVRRALASEATFKAFAGTVLGADAQKPDAVKALRDSVELWSLRFHTLISKSVPLDKPWGPARLDAIAMIYNRLNGLDLGLPPTYMIAENMAMGDAPARYPFLWNAGHQDKTQWGAWAANGTDGLALARNLGQVIGVFATFHPNPKTGTTVLDHDYLSTNSANIAGLATAEGLLKHLGPPRWPFPVDQALADKGQDIFNRPLETGGCAACHGIADGETRPPDIHTWKTVVGDAGTDARQWQVVLRSAQTGTLEGAVVPNVVAPLKATDRSLNILKTVVTGTLVEIQAAQAIKAAREPRADPQTAAPSVPPEPAAAPKEVKQITHTEMVQTMTVPAMPAKTDASASEATAPPEGAVYEARVLEGIWAAAPYLHNGSVPSLTELLKPAAERVKAFKVGPAYDVQTVGLASEQNSSFVLKTTGCEERASGNSNCGHEYGTHLSGDEKKALLEYLKTL
jgi:mono/diheme cytochrome c family protein